MTTNLQDCPYLDALQYILDFGDWRENRTGVDTLDVFGLKMNWDLSVGFPLLTTKRVHWPSVIWELLWFIRGETNVKWLHDKGVTIWDEWADNNGELGPVYGKQWRMWDCGVTKGRHEWVDQLLTVVERIKTHPDDRRLIVTAWNPADIPSMALPPCHLLYQFNVRNGKLDCQLYQRSCDMFLGVPFNIASYSALIYIVAHLTGLKPGEFHWVGGSCHIYENHMEQVQEQLSRTPRRSPILRITDDAPDNLDDDWGIEHFVLEGYNPHPGIKAPVAI